MRWLPHRRKTGRRSSGGVTLVEICAVIAIIATLAAVGVYVTAPAREKGRQAVCASNLKQIYQALYVYSSNWEGGAEVSRHIPLVEQAFIQVQLRSEHDPSRNTLFCPNVPACYRERRNASSYIFAVFQPDFRSQNPVVYAEYQERLEREGLMYPIVYCHAHQDLYYTPREPHVHPRLVAPFVIDLLGDGSIKAHRRAGVLERKTPEEYCQ